MTRNNVFVGDRRVLRRYIGDNLIFDDLANKTEILSGTEIWTDKADENSVVHVEVDGKSWQNVGSGKNLFDIRMIDESITSAGSTVGAPIKLRPNTTYTLSTNAVPISSMKDVFFDINRTAPSSGTNGVNADGTTTITTDSSGDAVVWVRARNSANDYNLNDFIEGRNWIQIEEGSTPTAYEPPAPTPDYPIKIHSLNDFDVVSSVGNRNLHKNTSDKWVELVRPAGNHFFQQGTDVEMLLGETYTFSIVVEKVSNDNIPINLHFGIGTENNFQWDRGAWGNVSNIPFGTKISRTFTVTAEDLSRGYKYFSWRLRNEQLATVIRYKEVKLEKGSTATPYSLAPEDISEDSNDTTTDKINLLLDEPLRSIEDVKDRLFRDVDGLWKVERNVSERRYIDNTINVSTPSSTGGTNSYHFGGSVAFIIGGGSQIGVAGTNTKYVISSHFKATSNNNFNSPSAAQNEVGTIMQLNTETNRLFVRVPESLIGAVEGDSVALLVSKFRNWANINKPYFYYRLLTPTIEILDQELQDKLNNLRSFKDSNYVYTVLPDKSNILSENLKPTLHATFKSIGWETFRKKVTKEE